MARGGKMRLMRIRRRRVSIFGVWLDGLVWVKKAEGVRWEEEDDDGETWRSVGWLSREMASRPSPCLPGFFWTRWVDLMPSYPLRV